ncbi:MAG: hypothetical protein J6Z49_10070 [Kiritimatiellae bacterium]|nr:hypothetical protein [Kiritimatiellia bacterium]
MDAKLRERLEECLSTVKDKEWEPFSVVITEPEFDKETDDKTSIKFELRCDREHHRKLQFIEAISPYVTIIVIAVAVMVLFGGSCFSCSKCCCQHPTSAKFDESSSTNAPVRN